MLSDAILCALAITVSPYVIAGTFGNTDASTRWTRSQDPTRPNRSLLKTVDLLSVWGKLDPQ